MNRRLLILPLVAISLLSSCSKVPDLRSDIAEFITSFSYDSAKKNYLEAKYTRVDVSHEASGEVLTVNTEMSFNMKDMENLTYEYRYKKSNQTQDIELQYCYIEKVEDGYLYYNGGESPLKKTKEEVVQQLISKFFYKDEIEGTHLRGNYVGDYLLETLPYIQNYVTIDKDKESLIYDIPLDAPKDVKDYNFSEVLVVDKYGMTESCDIFQTNGKTTLESTLRVYNYI